MGLFGKILATPVRIANLPFRATEKFVAAATGEPDRKEDRIMSVPLEAVAEAIEEVDD